MQLILITFVVNVLLYLVAANLRSRSRAQHANRVTSSAVSGSRLFQAIRKEFLSWLVVVAALVTIFLLLLIYSYFVGPIPLVHDWGK